MADQKDCNEATGPFEIGKCIKGNVQNLIEAHGFTFVSQAQQHDATRIPAANEIIERPTFTSIYGPGDTADYLLKIDNLGREVLVEVKSQQSAGTTDQSVASDYLNALAVWPERDFFLILEGEGFSDGALGFVCTRAKLTPGFWVLSADDLSVWLDEQINGKTVPPDHQWLCNTH